MICQHFVEQKLRFYLWFRLIQLQVEELPQQSTFHVIVYHNMYITIKKYSISNISHHLIPSLVFSCILSSPGPGNILRRLIPLPCCVHHLVSLLHLYFSTFPFVPTLFFPLFIFFPSSSYKILSLNLFSSFYFVCLLFINCISSFRKWSILKQSFCSILSFLSTQKESTSQILSLTSSDSINKKPSLHYLDCLAVPYSTCWHFFDDIFCVFSLTLSSG